MNPYNHQVNRKHFISAAGGIFTGYTVGSYSAESDLVRYYWQFFKQRKIRKSVKAIYADVVVDVLIKEKKYSIEHIVPKSFLYDYLKKKGHSRQYIRGALLNPFNFAPSHRKINSIRSSIPFDLDGDRAVISFQKKQPADITQFGLDSDNQWVLPRRSRGVVARATLYMANLYALQFPGLDIYKDWATACPPDTWELEFNLWIQRRYQIRNPYIALRN